MENNKLADRPLGRLILELSVPSIVAQLVSILYNMVDRMFIGRIENGTTAMAALSVSLPLITLITAITRLIGIGGAPLCAIKMGQKDSEGAAEIMSTSYAALIGAGALITLVILLFHKPILLLFGADATTLGMASEYIVLYSLGTIFVMIALGMNSYITTQGFAGIGMMTVAIGAVLNIFLDALFINVFKFGIKGAAIATIIGQGVSAAWALQFLASKKSILRLRLTRFKIKWPVLLSIMALGVSPFAMSATESVVQITYNNQLLRYGGTMAVSTVAILFSLWQFVSLPMQGICQGAQPIISYNYGARNFKRVRAAVKINVAACLVYSIGLCSLFIGLPGLFASIFTNDSDLLRLCAWALPIYIAGATVFGAQIGCQQSFMALGQAKISLVLACLRKIILLVPLLYILPMMMGDMPLMAEFAAPVADLVKSPGQVTSIFLAETVSDLLAAICTSVTFYIFYKKRLQENA